MLTLNDGRAELWQWDTGRTLAVDADCSQVHFSNKVFGRSIDVDVTDGGAIIPDILLQTDKDLNVWAFVGTAENGYTKISKTFKVNRRNKPADYVFTPVEQTTLAELSGRLDRIEESQDPDAIKNAVDDYLEQNPVEVPVKSVNGKTGTVELNAEDVGAISQEDLQAATNEALAQAKTSGEFDGADGQDGITPTIGDNGNWYLGDIDTGKPSRGETGPAGADGADGAPGADGKSAYQYARDGGYTGTEAEFAAKMAEEIPDTLPNPNALTFTGAVTGTYDGSAPLSVEIPSGGGGVSAVTPELLYSGTAENVSAFQQNIDMKGHRRFCVIVGGTKGESAIGINDGNFCLDGKRYKFFYYTNWLGATNTSYPKGCVTEHIALVDEDKIAITYQQNTVSLDGITTTFKGNSSAVTAPKLALLKGYNATNEDGILLTFSAVVESVTVYVFGY